MPLFDWEQFGKLPGANESNWERLCGGVIRRSFGSFGSFRYVAQQPGVEFHLKLERFSRELGGPPRWWGWQCRWYDIASGRPIGKRRRDKIEEAIRKTEQHVPDITDWVLWTRQPLTPADQKWFRGIKSTMNLELWADKELDTHLVGEAESLRETYFGDLVLTPSNLRSVRARSIESIKERWTPEVHVEVGAEREIQRILGEPQFWPEIAEQASGLATSIEELAAVLLEADEHLVGPVRQLAEDLGDLLAAFEAIAKALGEPSPVNAIEFAAADWVPRLTRPAGRALARKVHQRRHSAAFAIQAAMARQHDSMELLSEVQQSLSTSLVAVVGPAGSGKTHLAAGLTIERDGRPSGVYLEGWALTRHGTVDDLLPRLRGIRAESFEDVLEAVDAAGARAGRRLPVAIDGLSDSEDPANWKRELESLQPVLERLRHVVLVVTSRPPAVAIALPETCRRLEVRGFDSLTPLAVQRYFEYYKINRGSLPLPLDRLRTPLLLKVFCEATNPDRKVEVASGDIPTSLLETFVRFRETVTRRVANPPGRERRDRAAVLGAMRAIALALWDRRERAMPFDQVRGLIGDSSANWNDSLGRALVEEGILSRDPDASGDQRTAIAFDALAGFLIADALTSQMGRDDFVIWLEAEGTAARLGTDWQRAHPLAADIRKALVGLVPRTFPGLQFWHLVDDELREQAIVDAADLEGRLLDDGTVDEIARVALQPRSGNSGWLHRLEPAERLLEVRGAAGHPLNAEFVDKLLSGLTVADRDLRWTEWIRNSNREHLGDLDALTEKWKFQAQRTEEDRLHALWVKWLLTSTVRDLRDVATLALYWYGRGEPRALFGLALDSLDTNDPCVPERLLAASFGVMMAAPGEPREFGDELNDFIDGLWKAFCAEDAINPTDHWLIRHYVEGIVEVARRYYPHALGSHSGEWCFSPADKLEPIARDDPRNSPSDLVYGLDFANYTVGRLIPGRGSYQYEHPGYQEVCSWIRARVWELGWRSEQFSEVEQRIRQDREFRRGHGGRIESYRKKYGWAGFYEAAGRLIDENRSPFREGQAHLTDVDIDPSFPSEPPVLTLELPGLLSEEFENLESWVTAGNVEVPDELLRTDSLDETPGPWVALSGFFNQEDIDSRRRGFGFLHAVLVERENEQQLRRVLCSERHPGSLWNLRSPEEYYVFAGEMPWSPCARRELQGGDVRQLYAGTVPERAKDAVSIESPTHYYSWESYHSVTNKAGGYPVPALTLAESFDLRAIPTSLDWCDAEGRRVSVTLSLPSNINGEGHFLYVREDLIREYCAAHDYEVVWIVWGEREVWFADYSRDLPDWLSKAYEDCSNVWRRIASLDEVASA